MKSGLSFIPSRSARAVAVKNGRLRQVRIPYFPSAIGYLNFFTDVAHGRPVTRELSRKGGQKCQV